MLTNNLNKNFYKEKLYCRGFLYFSKEIDCQLIENLNWNSTKFSNGIIFFHKLTKLYKIAKGNVSIALIGHAYDPFSMVSNENVLLDKLSNKININEMIESINNWTGLFTLIIAINDKTYLIGDCACMQSCYYGVKDDLFFATSHSQLIGDIFCLDQTKYVKKIKKYKFWQKYGLFLPGDTTQFELVKRLVPNNMVIFNDNQISVKRFFPLKDNNPVINEEEYMESISKIGNILHNNLLLISKKWKHPAISMTGGMDSKTTVASANGMYDKFSYYSYDSMFGDRIDCDAAKKIAQLIDVTHKIYIISENDSDFPYIDDLRKIIEINYGNIGKVNSNDVRKRVFFMDTTDFDVEVKSWVSEIGRANYYKKFNLKKMPKRLSSRNMTSMYKFFAWNRLTAYKTSKIFKEYIKKTNFYSIYNYDSSDMYLWEFRYGAWGGLVLSAEHRISYDITIPFNNRILINEFLKFPLEKRIKDIPHYDVIRWGNDKIDKLGITVTNWNETKKRSLLERIYFKLNSILPL